MVFTERILSRVRKAHNACRFWAALSFTAISSFIASVEGAQFSSAVAEKMRRTDAPLDVIVTFKEQIGRSTEQTKAESFGQHTPAARLKARAAASRPPLSSLFPTSSAAPATDVATDLWLANAYRLTLPAKMIEQLGTDPRVATIVDNSRVELPEILPSAFNTSAPTMNTNWGLQKVGVLQTWYAFHLSGRGVRIGHLDTGVDADHPALTGKVAAWAEFNDAGHRIDSQPHDWDIHGTHTAGLIVGGTPQGQAIGAAPDAKLLSAKVLTSEGGTIAQVIAGMQWTLDPDDNPDSNDGAHILSMSLGATGQHEVFEEIVARLLQANVLPVFAIGNSGGGSTLSPGNVPGVLSVGATGPSDEAASFSSGGTAYWYGQAHLKPEISAPGIQIFSSVPGGRYRYYSGTSMATPLVAGAAALVKELTPNMPATDLRSLLERTAVDLGTPGQDERYGYGRLNALGALVAVSSGTLILGRVEGQDGTVPAIICAKDPTGRMVDSTQARSSTGEFSMILPAGSYIVDASFGAVRLEGKEVIAVPGTMLEVNFSFSGRLDGLRSLLVYPNPFKPSRGDRNVVFGGLPENTFLTIYSMSGEIVKEFKALPAGETPWDARDAQGNELGSGIYYYLARLQDAESGWVVRKGKVAVIR